MTLCATGETSVRTRGVHRSPRRGVEGAVHELHLQGLLHGSLDRRARRSAERGEPIAGHKKGNERDKSRLVSAGMSRHLRLAAASIIDFRSVFAVLKSERCTSPRTSSHHMNMPPDLGGFPRSPLRTGEEHGDNGTFPAWKSWKLPVGWICRVSPC